MIRVALCTAALAFALPAQEPKDASQPPRPAAERDAAPLFYKAYYLWHGEQRHDEALELYREFLERAPEHAYAGKAARDAIAILRRQDRTEEARTLRRRFAGPLAALEQDPGGAGPGERPGPGAGEGPGGRGERGGFRGRRGGMRIDFSDLTDEEIDARVQRLDRFLPRLLDRLRERSGEEEAAAAEKRWQRVKELLADGDTAVAQKEWEELSSTVFRRRDR